MVGDIEMVGMSDGSEDSVVETDGYSVGEIDNVGSAEGDIDMVGAIETVGMSDGAEDSVGETDGYSVGEIDNVGIVVGDVDIETVGMSDGAEEIVGESEYVDGLPDGRGEVVGCGSVSTNEGGVLGNTEGGVEDIISFRIKILSFTALLPSASSLLTIEGMKMPRATMIASKPIINTSVHLFLEIKDPPASSNSWDGFDIAESGDPPALSNIRSSSSSCAMDSCGLVSSS
jgi:hypothetical protein